MKIKRNTFASMLDRVMKKATDNKLLPMTSLVNIKSEGGKLFLETTDGANYLIISTTDFDGAEDFNYSVSIDTLPKLISRMTCDEVSIENKGKYIEVSGGKGKFKVDIPVDENGQYVVFPEVPTPTGENEEHYTLTADNIKTILTANKSAISPTVEVPCYANFYVSPKGIVTTDTIVMCGYTGFKEVKDSMLISPELMSTLSVMQADNVDMAVCGNMIMFSTADALAYGNVSDGIEDYQIDAVQGLIDENYPSMCRVSKTELMSVLDRVTLFIGNYDDDAINIQFGEDALTISSKHTTGVDEISYSEMENVEPASYAIGATILLSQLKAYAGDTVTIYFGIDSAIKLQGADTIQLIGLVES